MAWRRTRALVRLFGRTWNPLPMLFDYLGLKRRPYVMRTRDGHAIEIRPGTSDRFFFREVLVHLEYLRQGQTISPGDTVVDIGANIGCFSILAARRAGPTGRVIAVEPGPAAYEQLCRNLELNALDNVTLVRAAVGDRDETARFHVYDKSGLSSLYESVDGRNAAGQTVDVEVMTLATLFAAQRIHRCDYLKVDCEGGEYAIVRGMGPDLASRIRQITLEVHRIPDHEPAEVRERLTALGFEIVRGPLLYGRRKSSFGGIETECA
jgi:FkbM family methyltransferase